MELNHAGKLAFGPFHDLADAEPAAMPPEGFEQMPIFGPFHEALGPMFVKREKAGHVVGMRVEDKHRNRGQMMHGGMICTLADTATHWAAKHAREPILKVLTTGLSVNLMGNAKPGEWVEAHAEVLRAGRSIVFANCLITCAGRVVAQATAQFQIVPEPIAATLFENA
jgi:uncharacterized protein (TIGR00369 family)